MTDDSTKDVAGDVGPSAGTRVPPYIAFATFMTFLKDLKTNGLPPQIDKSVMTKMSGGAQSQMKIALRSLELMEGDKPTERLRLLVDALETPDFDPMLTESLKVNYPYVFALDLPTATPTMFADAFKVTGAKEDVARKCRTFFLHAAKRVGIPLGQRILTGVVPRSPPGTKRKPRVAKSRDATNGSAVPLSPPSQVGENSPLVQQLLGKFPELDPAWPDDIKGKWFASFEQLMKSAKLK